MEFEIEIDDDLLADLKQITGLTNIDAICDLALREMIEERCSRGSLAENQSND